MHARVVHSKGDPAKVDEVTRMIKETVIPNAKKFAGFKGGYWLIDRTTGTGLGVTVFESEAALQASEEAAKKIREGAPATGVQITGVERYEVIAQA
jgi:hypothetical protein